MNKKQQPNENKAIGVQKSGKMGKTTVSIETGIVTEHGTTLTGPGVPGA